MRRFSTVPFAGTKQQEQQLRAWLEERLNAVPRDTIEAKSAFLDSEPWTPPAPEEEKDEDAPPF